MMGATFRKPTVMGLAVVLLLCTGVLHRWVYVARATLADVYTPLTRPLADLPERIGSYVLEGDLPLDTDTLRASGVDSFINRSYVSGITGRRLQLYVGYWARENAGMGHGPEVCYPVVGWQAQRAPVGRTISFDAQNGSIDAQIALHRFTNAQPEGIEKLAVGFTTVVSGEFRRSSRDVFWHRPGRLHPAGGHYLAHVHVACAVPDGEWDAAESDIVMFMAKFIPEFVEYLPRPLDAFQPASPE